MSTVVAPLPSRTTGVTERRMGLTSRGWIIAGCLFFVALLELAPRLGWIDAFSLPPLSTIFVHAGQLLGDGTFWADSLLPSLTAIALSFVLASSIGVVI